MARYAFLAYLAGAALTGFLQREPRPMLAAIPALGLPALPAVAIALVDETVLAFKARMAKRGPA